MSEPQAEQRGRGGLQYDAPNQQLVRPDGSPPGTPPDGEGGSTPGAAPATTSDQAESDTATSLDEMTKEELLAYAKEREISPANNAMTKDELRASIDEHEGK